MDYREEVRKEIELCFLAPSRGEKAQNVALRFVNGSNKTRYMPLRTAVEDCQGSTKVMDALINVLANSKCEHVIAWREAMIDDYFSTWGDELVDIDMAEDGVRNV